MTATPDPINSESTASKTLILLLRLAMAWVLLYAASH